MNAMNSEKINKREELAVEQPIEVTEMRTADISAKLEVNSLNSLFF